MRSEARGPLQRDMCKMVAVCEPPVPPPEKVAVPAAQLPSDSSSHQFSLLLFGHTVVPHQSCSCRWSSSRCSYSSLSDGVGKGHWCFREGGKWWPLTNVHHPSSLWGLATQDNGENCVYGTRQWIYLFFFFFNARWWVVVSWGQLWDKVGVASGTASVVSKEGLLISLHLPKHIIAHFAFSAFFLSLYDLYCRFSRWCICTFFRYIAWWSGISVWL